MRSFSFIEMPSKMFPQHAELFNTDPVFQKVDNALGDKINYQSAHKVVSETKPTQGSINLLVPCLLMTSCIQNKALLRNVNDVKGWNELVTLLKTCLKKGYKYDEGIASIVLRFTVVGLKIYQAAGINISQGFGPAKESIFHIGSLSPLHEPFFVLGFEQGVDPNSKELVTSQGNWGNTTLHNIIANERHDMLQCFVSHAIKNQVQLNLTVKDKEGKNILLLAAKMRDERALTFLSEKAQKHPKLFKVDFSACDNQGRNGLHYGCLYKSPTIIRMFARNGAGSKQVDKFKWRFVNCLTSRKPQDMTTPLREVSIDEKREMPMPQALLSSIFGRSKKKSVLAHCRSDAAFSAAVQTVLDCKLLNRKTDRELVFRNLASKATNCLSLLISLNQLGVDVNASGASGNTALHVAAKIGNLQHAQWLLDQGAKSQKNAKGKLPTDLCAENTRMQALFQEGSLPDEESMGAVCSIM